MPIVAWALLLPPIFDSLGIIIPRKWREFREPFLNPKKRTQLIAIWHGWLDQHYPITEDAELIARCALTAAVFAPCTAAYVQRKRFDNAKATATDADLRDDEVGEELPREDDGDPDFGQGVDLGSESGVGGAAGG